MTKIQIKGFQTRHNVSKSRLILLRSMENVINGAISSYKDHCNFCFSNTIGPYFGANFEYLWSLSGPYFSWIFKKILARIGKNWKTI